MRLTAVKTLRVVFLIVCGVVISSCASTAVFDPRACPVEKTYTREELRQAADALDRADPILQGFMVDYGRLRDKARACRGVR